MDNILKGILIGAGLFITCVVVGIGFMVARESIRVSAVNSEKLNKFSIELSESDLTMYDGLEVQGSDVINFIKENLGDYTSTETAPVTVNVITSKSNNTYINGASVENICDFTNDKYIKPIAKFDCKVIRNSNNAITTLRFTQK